MYDNEGTGSLTQKYSNAADQIHAKDNFISIGVSGVASQYENSYLPSDDIILTNIKSQDVMSQVYANGTKMEPDTVKAVRNYSDNNYDLYIGSNYGHGSPLTELFEKFWCSTNQFLVKKEL